MAAGAEAMATAARTHPHKPKHPQPLGRAAPWQQRATTASLLPPSRAAAGPNEEDAQLRPLQMAGSQLVESQTTTPWQHGQSAEWQAAISSSKPCQPHKAPALAPKARPHAWWKRRAAPRISPHARRRRSASPTKPRGAPLLGWQERPQQTDNLDHTSTHPHVHKSQDQAQCDEQSPLWHRQRALAALQSGPSGSGYGSSRYTSGSG